MSKFKTELVERINRFFENFLEQQLGEHVTTVTTFLSGDMLSVRADNCLSPAERDLMQNQRHSQLLQEFKARQFKKVEPLLKEQLETLMGVKILNINSMVGQDGVRFEFLTLDENLENKLIT
ncbi:MAG: Na-translocating system protein MpsC family protein [Calditrichaeota bacterium]|nr:Na-translocating system protein MpsC family protein [Calditrichota bacterium]